MLALGHEEETPRTEYVRGVIARFAGLDFELHGDAGACGRFVRAARVSEPSLARSDAVAPNFAVRCHLVHSSTPEAPVARLPGSGIAWRWGEGEGEGEVLTHFGHARVARAGGRFVAHVSVGADRHAPHFLLSGLAALVLHRCGGGILHAASVELEAGVVAFVGPSGAGKTTACRHVEGAPLFSVDTLAVLPAAGAGPLAPDMWLAHPLPGGTRPDPDMPSAAARWLPLRGVLRVHRAPAGGAVEPLPHAPAVAALRESAFQVGLGVGAEHELLARLEALASGVSIGRLHWRLGASLKPVLIRWHLEQVRSR